MEQDHSSENGPKEGKVSHKSSGSNHKPINGRGGNAIGAGLAMKIPGKQGLKTTQGSKKRPAKHVGQTGKEGLTPSMTTLDLPNGNNGHQSGSRSGREGKKLQRDEKTSNRLSPSFGHNAKNRSLNSSRNNSLSPVDRLDSGDGSNDKRPALGKIEMEHVDLSDNEVSSQNLKQLLSIGNPTRIAYSRTQLLNISENPSSKNRPECLEKDFNATNGRWDPENWHRSLSSPPAVGEKLQKFSFSENRDRFVEDSSQGGIILGPQRRSFQDGCHVTSNPASRLSKNHLASPTEATRHSRPRLVLRQRSETDYDSSPAPNRERQIESASALRTEEFDWDKRGESRFRERDLSDLRARGPRELPRDLHELRNRDDYRDRDYRERKFSHSREYGSNWYQSQPRDRRDHRYEAEPEWYTDGPSNRYETIELAGFEEETPAAAADFSSWGGEIPMDDLETNNEEIEKKKERQEEKSKERKDEEKSPEKSLDVEKQAGEEENTKGKESVDAADVEKNEEEELTDLDFNDMLGIPGFSAVMEQILKENSATPPANIDKTSEEPQSSSSRFSQWFQRDQEGKNESGSGVSTPYEELENLAELAAERGLASPVDVDAKQQQPQQSTKNGIMRLLTQSKSGSVSPSMKPDSLDQQELARKLILQQMKTGSVMSVAELEAKAGARQSPSQSYGGVDVQNTDAFNKLVSSIREKDKIRQRQQLIAQQQAAIKFADQYQTKSNMNIPGGRIPSPEELAAHTQNIFQQALIKKQLEKQKDAYREKIRQIEQQRREEQLREAIRSADAKMQESKQMNKSLAFMPTSVMRKMLDSNEGKMNQIDSAEMMNLQQQQMMGGEADDLASATASFSAKLANSSKKSQVDPLSRQGNDLLARIYQSAGAQQTKVGRSDNPGLRRNASYPEVLMDANKLGRSSAFHQPVRHSIAANSLDLNKLNLAGEQETTRLRNLITMSNEMGNPNMMSRGKPAAPKQQSGNLADIYNNNMLKSEAGKFDNASGKPVIDRVDKAGSDAPDVENQHEVALLTQFVLNRFGINEDQLSRLTPQQQQAVVNIVQEQYYLLQQQKQRMLSAEKKAQKDGNNPLRLKQGELPPPNAAKNEFQGAAANKNVKMDQNDPRTTPQAIISSAAVSKSNSAQTQSSSGMKFPQQQAGHIPGVAGMQGLLQTTNQQIHPLHLRSLVPPPMQFLPPPMARAPMIPATYLPPQTHIPGRLMPPPPPNVPLASPLGGPYPAAALMQMQLYHQQQQQHRAFFAAAALQQQQLAHHQAMAAARQQQHQKENRGDFANPLERWFGREVLSQSHLPQQKPLTLHDVERVPQTNQKHE